MFLSVAEIWGYLHFFADNIIIFFSNLLHLLWGLKVLVSLSLLAYPEVLGLLALQHHLLDQGYPKMYHTQSIVL